MDVTLMKKLSEACGVSGDEGEVRKIIVEAIKDHVDDYRTDALGNLLAVKRGGDDSFRVMVAAHMDEVGLMVVHIEDGGWLRFRPVNGIDRRLLPAKVVWVGQDKVPGIIGVKPIHLLTQEEQKQVLAVENLAIDIGADSKEAAEKRVKVGDYATFATRFAELTDGGAGGIVKGKAFDDRVGCAVLIELLKQSYPFTLHAAFTVQEELGLRGAKVAAFSIEPHAAFVLEGTIADDLPKEKDVSPTTTLGGGPAISIVDRRAFADRRLVRLLVETAEANDIPYQFKQPGIGGTDAGSIHLTGEGVPTAVASVPCRYIHSPVALTSQRDFDYTVTLMTKALPELSREEYVS